MTLNAHDLSVRILAGFLSVIMTLLMFLPMKAAFSQNSLDLSGHYSGSMDITSDFGETKSHPAVATFQQTQGALSGSIGFSADRQMPIKHGKVLGSTVMFIVRLSDGSPLEFRLDVQDQKLTGGAHANAGLGRIRAKVALSRDP